MPEERRYAYTYAIIDTTDNMCVEVRTQTNEVDTTAHPEYIPIPSYNEEYIMKYYSYETQKWYEDTAFTIEWIQARKDDPLWQTSKE